VADGHSGTPGPQRKLRIARAIPHAMRLPLSQGPPGDTGTGPRSGAPGLASGVTSRSIWRGGVLLTCRAPLADGIVIGHGLSFEVAVFGSEGSLKRSAGGSGFRQDQARSCSNLARWTRIRTRGPARNISRPRPGDHPVTRTARNRDLRPRAAPVPTQPQRSRPCAESPSLRLSTSHQPAQTGMKQAQFDLVREATD
jgi:hypothetical protein